MSDELIILDLDGTLVDSAIEITNAANLARINFGFAPANPEFLKSRIGLPALDLFNDLEVTESTLTKMVENFRSILSRSIENQIDVFPGSIEFLTEAKARNIKLAVATNKPIEMARRVVFNSELRNLIDLTIGINGKFLPKPAPDILLFAINYFSITDAVMIGDRREDMQAAKSAAIGSIGLTQGIHSEQELKEAGAHSVFNSFRELHHFYSQNSWRAK